MMNINNMTQMMTQIESDIEFLTSAGVSEVHARHIGTLLSRARQSLEDKEKLQSDLDALGKSMNYVEEWLAHTDQFESFLEWKSDQQLKESKSNVLPR